MISIGRRVEISPAYNSETGQQDIWDEIAGKWGHVIGYSTRTPGDHLVRFLDGEEDWVYVTRLRER